jgi:hypothetical protein
MIDYELVASDVPYDHNETLSLIKELRAVLIDDLNCQGCDHEVGICVCGLLSLLARTNAFLGYSEDDWEIR